MLSGREPFRRLILRILKLEHPHISGICVLSPQRFKENGIGKAYGARMSSGRKFKCAKCKPGSLPSQETYQVKQNVLKADAAGEIKSEPVRLKIPRYALC